MIQQALAETAFKEDHNKRLRLKYLRNALVANIRGIAAPTGYGKWAKTKRYRTRHHDMRSSNSTNLSQQRKSICEKDEGWVVKNPHMKWSWSKPGIFFLAGAPANSRQGGRGLGGGPGIPNGAAGDYG